MTAGSLLFDVDVPNTTISRYVKCREGFKESLERLLLRTQRIN